MKCGKMCLSMMVVFALVAGAGVWWLSSARAADEQPATHPRKVAPGATNAQPPADAVVLFDGSSLNEWTGNDGVAKWDVTRGYAQVAPKSGAIWTKTSFGDCQLHLEFATPNPPTGEGQGCGNSGVYLQGRYEVQILDSYTTQTGAMGQCGAIYGHHAPLVNATRPPGEWQTYDITFFAPRFDEAGKVTEPARLTVFHNGVLIQHNAPVPGPTAAAMFGDMKPTGPLVLQDHGNLVRYRNIWIRPLDQ